MDVNYRILDYEQVQMELDRLVNNPNAKYKIVKKDDFKPTRLGYPVDHFTVGNGNKHIVILGNTHGSEIISCDFVLKLMESISEKKNGFENLDLEEVTIDFVPLHNPEGYIISTSAIKTVIKDDMSNEEKEKLCKEYWALYRQDDINARNNPEDHETLKNHQKMFENADYNCIPVKHEKLRESVKNIQQTYNHPKGSMVVWRANGSGVELNRNQPLNSSFLEKKSPEYASLRYNNILENVPGPIGVSSITLDSFQYEPENQNIINLVDELYKNGQYCGFLTYHATYGKVFANPTYEADESILDDEKRIKITAINRFLANEYFEPTGYGLIDDPDIEGTDELLRILYPAVLLIELSKMGGNPIAPYGDISGNYTSVMKNNMQASSKVIKLLPKMYDFIYDKSLLLEKVEHVKK